MLHIVSEIAPLKEALVHRPDLGQRKLVPESAESYLFDDIMWIKEALREHRMFTDYLESYRTKPLFVEDLFEEISVNPEARMYALKLTAQLNYHDALSERTGQRFLDNFYQVMMDLPVKQFVEYMFSGLMISDAEKLNLPLPLARYAEEGKLSFILPPLPNMLFMRDTSCWIGNGVTINSMQYAPRRSEIPIIKTVYAFHPRFTGEKFNIWYDSTDPERPEGNFNTKYGLEGGDVLVLTDKTILVGMGERTNPHAVQLLAARLLKESQYEEVLCIQIPKERSSMHLDTVFTRLTENIFTYGMPFPIEMVRSFSVHIGNNKNHPLQITEHKSFKKALANSLGMMEHDLQFLSITNPITNAREQWTDAMNLLMLKPGHGTIYARNEVFIDILKKAGITPLIIEGFELSRGRGGGRCMSCPILRENV